MSEGGEGGEGEKQALSQTRAPGLLHLPGEKDLLPSRLTNATAQTGQKLGGGHLGQHPQHTAEPRESSSSSARRPPKRWSPPGTGSCRNLLYKEGLGKGVKSLGRLSSETAPTW